MLWESLFTNLWPWEEVSSLDWRFSFGWESGIGESWRSYIVQRTTLTDPSVRLLIIKGPVNWINDHRQEATLPRMGILVSLGQFEPLKILVLSHVLWTLNLNNNLTFKTYIQKQSIIIFQPGQLVTCSTSPIYKLGHLPLNSLENYHSLRRMIKHLFCWIFSNLTNV